MIPLTRRRSPRETLLFQNIPIGVVRVTSQIAVARHEPCALGPLCLTVLSLAMCMVGLGAIGIGLVFVVAQKSNAYTASGVLIVLAGGAGFGIWQSFLRTGLASCLLTVELRVKPGRVIGRVQRFAEKSTIRIRSSDIAQIVCRGEFVMSNHSQYEVVIQFHEKGRGELHIGPWNSQADCEESCMALRQLLIRS